MPRKGSAPRDKKRSPAKHKLANFFISKVMVRKEVHTSELHVTRGFTAGFHFAPRPEVVVGADVID